MISWNTLISVKDEGILEDSTMERTSHWKLQLACVHASEARYYRFAKLHD